MFIPKPFSTVRLVSSEPVYVPENATREQISRVRDELQAKMDELNAGYGVTKKSGPVKPPMAA